MLANPRMHGDACGHARVDGASRTKLRDGTGHQRRILCLRAHPGPLLPEEEQAALGQFRGLQWNAPGGVIDGHDGEALVGGPGHQIADVRVVHEVLVPVSHHGAAPVPAAASHNVDGVDGKGVGSADHGADVGIVFEVLDGDVQRMPALIDILPDRLACPVTVGIDDIAAIPLREQFGIVFLRFGAFGQRAFPRANT